MYGSVEDHLRAPATITALTGLRVALASHSAALEAAYRVNQSLQEAYLLEHVARLGRMNAEQRLYSFMLELEERLTRCGLSDEGKFPLAMNQDVLADMLGLTSVHVNRTLQRARRSGEISYGGGFAQIHDVKGLSSRLGRPPIRVFQ